MAGFLAQHGYSVDLIGSTFQHFKKAPRDIERLKAMTLPYQLVFIDCLLYTSDAADEILGV